MATYRSNKEWSAILLAYEDREDTREQFCAEYGISPAALSYQQRKQQDRTAPKVVELIPAALSSGGNFREATGFAELNCEHPSLGAIMVRCEVSDISSIVTQLGK